MKGLIIAFALIVAVSCDVSEIVQGDGWHKDATGYHYDTPSQKFDNVPEEPIVPVVSVAVEAPLQLPVADEPETVVAADPTVEEVIEVVEDVPENNLREYLPPKDDAKRKRQVPVRKQVRKVYRRVVRKSVNKKRY